MNDLYEALIETATPVVRSAPRGRRGARARCASCCATPGATFIGGGLHPDAAFGDVVHVQTAALPGDPATRCAGSSRARRPPRCTSTSGCPTPRPRSPSATACARTCRCCRRSRPTRRSGTAHDSGFASARAPIFRAFPRSHDPAAVRELGRTTRRSIRWCVATADVADYTYLWWDIRPSPNLGTVEVRAMDAQSAAGDRRRARRARPRARGRLRATAPRRPRRRPRRSWSPPSAPPATASTRRSGGAARCARSARSAPTRSRSPAPTRATSTARTRSRRSSASCARAAARTACARPTPPAGWTRCSPGSPRAETYGSTQTTSPIRSQS